MYPIELPEFTELEHAILKSNRLWSGCTAEDLAQSLQREVQDVTDALEDLERDGYVAFVVVPQEIFIGGLKTTVAKISYWKLTKDGQSVSRYL